MDEIAKKLLDCFDENGEVKPDMKFYVAWVSKIPDDEESRLRADITMLCKACFDNGWDACERRLKECDTPQP